MQKVSMIQAGFYSAILITAAANVRVGWTHDQKLVEVPLWQKLEQHAGRLLLGNHTDKTDHVWVLELCQHGGLLQQKTDE